MCTSIYVHTLCANALSRYVAMHHCLHLSLHIARTTACLDLLANVNLIHGIKLLPT
jgi:hypothetical protein